MAKQIWIAAAAAIASSGALLSMPASAHSSVHYVAPAPVYQYAPAPHYGKVWVPGHWEWQGNRHVWVPGQYVYGAGHQGHYYNYNHYRGRRDLDRDGIPDRYDRDLDNDGVRNRHDRDRDGDGVPNWHDRAPRNRYRY